MPILKWQGDDAEFMADLLVGQIDDFDGIIVPSCGQGGSTGTEGHRTHWKVEPGGHTREFPRRQLVSLQEQSQAGVSKTHEG